MHTLITFDVSDNRLRYRLVKALLEHGQRVQKSVFEATSLETAQYLRLRSRCEGIIDTDTDSLRYYQLCQACAKRVEHVGVGPGLLEEAESFKIIGG